MSPKRKSKVLAIDDEPAMTEWLKILLEHAGYEVRTALIGTRGEELFKTWRPDSVITDMMLPDVDGIELVRKFKQLDPIDVGQQHVGDDGVRTPSLEDLFATCANQRRLDFESCMLEQDLQPLGHRRLIVYGKNSLLTFKTHGA